MPIKDFVLGDFATNSYVFPISDGEFCVVDIGGDGSEVVRWTKAQGGKISSMLFTHGHFDHTSGLTTVLQNFPDAKIFVSQEDSHFFGENSLAENLNEFRALGIAGLVDESIFPLKRADFLLKDGQVVLKNSQEFPNGLTTIATPGHTRGSVGFYSEEKSCLFAGDTIFAFGSRGRTDGLSASDEQINKSILKILSLPANTKIFCGHGESTTVEIERKYWI